MNFEDFLLPDNLKNFFVNPTKISILEEYIKSEVQYFFVKNLRLSSVGTYISPDIIDPFSFAKAGNNTIEMKLIYEELSNSIDRRSNDELIIKPLWTITLDAEVAAVEVFNLYQTNQGNNRETRWDGASGRPRIPYMKYPENAKKYRAYNAIWIGDKPLLIYLHFTFQELIDCVKESKFKPL